MCHNWPVMKSDGTDIHIAYRHTDALDCETVTAAEATLSSLELARRDQFRLPEDRRDYTLAHDLLRRTLSRYAGVQPNEWNFKAGPYGKPFITSPPIASKLSFSLSHTRGLVACGVAAGREVGLDVERTDRELDIDGLAEQFFSSCEVNALRRYDGESRKVAFIELWTLKEAFVKAIGRGLSQPLNTFTFDLDRESPILLSPAAEEKALFWQFAVYAPSPSTRMAVAVRSSEPEDIRFDARSGDGTCLTPIRCVLSALPTS